MRMIDADALLKSIIQMSTDGNVFDKIRNAPTIEPQKWIPVSERLPKSNGIYNVTRNVSDGFECSNITDTCYFDGSNTWHDDTRVNHGRKYLNDVVAWMPLPKPYEEGNNEVN